MAIPTPSFFKIRLKLVIILVFAFLFLVGFLKKSFAEGPRYTYQLNIVLPFPPVGNFSKSKKVEFNHCTGKFKDLEVEPGGGQCVGKLYAADIYEGSNPVWGTDAGTVCEKITIESYTKDCPCPEEKVWNSSKQICEIACQVEKQNYIQNCGGEDKVDWSKFKYETCSGATCKCEEGFEHTDEWGCKPICPSKVRTVPDGVCIPYCHYAEGRTPGTINNYGRGNCIDPPCGSGEKEVDGKCQPNCIEPAKLDVTTGQCFKPTPKCGPCETLTSSGCVAPPQCESGTYRNWETCKCTEEKPPDCPPNQHWNGIKCVPDVILRCDPGFRKDAKGDCVKDPEYCENPGEYYDKDQKKCVPKTPADKGKEPPQDDGQLQRNMAENLKKIADNLKALIEGIGTISREIGEIIGGAIKSLGNELGELGEKFVEGIEKLNGSIGKIGEKVNGIGAQVDNISNGTFSRPAQENPYQTPDNDFGQRTSQFFSQIRSTAIFSIPDQLSNAIPGGGSSVLTIHTGETYGGDIQIDFAELSNALMILRSIVMISAMTLAIRIITLKR